MQTQQQQRKLQGQSKVSGDVCRLDRVQRLAVVRGLFRQAGRIERAENGEGRKEFRLSLGVCHKTDIHLAYLTQIEMPSSQPQLTEHKVHEDDEEDQWSVESTRDWPKARRHTRTRRRRQGH